MTTKNRTALTRDIVPIETYMITGSFNLTALLNGLRNL